jgi:PAS domain S-box-containing protein
MKPEEFAALTAQLDAMATDSAEAESFLSSMATAMFPGGRRNVEGMTWPDAGKGTTNENAGDAESRLRAAELRFRTLVEQIPAVTFMAVLGEGKNEIYVSPHVQAMLGFSQEEWLSDPFLWYTQLHPGDRDLWNQEFARGCRTGGPFRAECRFFSRDQRVVWVHGEARLVRDEQGRPMFLQGVAFDITESKRAQEVLVQKAISVAKEEEEMAIARRVQTSILPKHFDVEGLEIAAVMFPATDVGGDYYDVLPFKGGSWLAIGDVSGHGLDAGLVMLMVQSAVVSITAALPEATPREVIVQLNEVLFDNIRRRLLHDDHVTFTLFRYTTDGRIVFAGAHEDILITRKKKRKVEVLHTPGTWLGARRDISRVTVDATLTLEEGDVLVLYTDGVTEAMNDSGEQFGITRLSDVIEKHQDEPIVAIRDHVIRAVQAWSKNQEDDISILIARRLSSSSP